MQNGEASEGFSLIPFWLSSFCGKCVGYEKNPLRVEGFKSRKFPGKKGGKKAPELHFSWHQIGLAEDLMSVTQAIIMAQQFTFILLFPGGTERQQQQHLSDGDSSSLASSANI